MFFGINAIMSKEDFIETILKFFNRVEESLDVCSVNITQNEGDIYTVLLYKRHLFNPIRIQAHRVHYHKLRGALLDLGLIKYTLTSNTVVKNDKTLYQVRYNSGKLGGYIESEKNLSHSTDATIGDNCYIYGDSTLVFGTLNNCSLNDSGTIFLYEKNEATEVKQGKINGKTVTLIGSKNEGLSVFTDNKFPMSTDCFFDFIINKHVVTVDYRIELTVKPDKRVPVEEYGFYGEFLNFGGLINIAKTFVTVWWKLGLRPKKDHFVKIKKLCLNSPEKIKQLKEEKQKKLNQEYLKKVRGLNQIKQEYGSFDNWMNGRKNY